MLAAGAADMVAAAVLLDGPEALGAALGVDGDPLEVLRLAAELGVPLVPHGARARRVRRRRAVEAEAHAAGALHLAVPLAGVHDADRAPAVWGARAPLHRRVVVQVRVEDQVLEALGGVGVLAAKEAPHGGVVADGRALHLHAVDVFLAVAHGREEMLRPT